MTFTGDANEATSAINRVQSSLQFNLSSRLTAAIGQTASPYVNAEQAFLDNHFGVGTETIVNSGIEFGADTLGVLGAGSTLRELAPELNASYNLRSPLVPVGAGEMGMFGIKGLQNPLVLANQQVGGDFENYVFEQRFAQLADTNATVVPQQRAYISGLDQAYVIPDFTVYTGEGNIAYYADAKSGAIAFDTQAQGLINLSSQYSLSKTLIYYTPEGNTLIPQALTDYARARGVAIRQIGVP